MTPSRRSRCRAHRPTLDAIIDGRETLDARETLADHARTCPACERELSVSVSLRRALDAALAAEPGGADDQAFASRVFARIDAGAGTDATGPRRPGRMRLLPRLGLAAACAAAIALLVRSGEEGDSSDPVTRVAQASPPQAQQPGRGGDARSPDSPPEAVDGEPLGASIAVEIDRRPLDADAFAATLTDVADALGFDAGASGSAVAFSTAVRDRFDGDARRAAQEILRTSPGRDAAPLAARLLGVAADLQDRALLTGLVGELGRPAAFGLADRGRAGTQELWRIARDRRGDAQGVAAEALVALCRSGDAQRDPLRWIDPSDDARLGPMLVASSPLHGAPELLSRFLDRDSPDGSGWLDAWAIHPGAGASLAAAIGRENSARSASRSDEIGLLRAVAALGAPEGLGFALDALERGTGEAAAALASIDDPDALRALFGLTLRGRLSPDVEELAWTRMITARGALAVAVAGERADLAEPRAAALVDVLVRSDLTETAAGRAAADVLAHLAWDEALPGDLRADALLLLAERSALAPEESRVACERVLELRRAPDPRVAAAAWLIGAPGEDGTPPPHVRSALERRGSLTVRHARLTRVIEHAARPARSGAL